MPEPSRDPDERRVCGWCRGPIRRGSRRDAIYCRTLCRQAAHRTLVRRSELEATDRPLRLAYADPPYVGLARRFYRDEPTYAGEVDHVELLSRLQAYDGWALSCSSASTPALLAVAVGFAGDVRLGIWHRRRPAGWSASGWEGVIYRPARRVGPRTTDVLLGVDGRSRPTHPGAVVGMKPPAFATWLFGLLGARPGDEFADLFPGSGLVAKAWRDWSRRDLDDEYSRDGSLGDRADAS